MKRQGTKDSVRVHCTRGYLRHLLYQAIEAGIAVGEERGQAALGPVEIYEELEDIEVVKRAQVDRLVAKQHAHQFPHAKEANGDDD